MVPCSLAAPRRGSAEDAAARHALGMTKWRRHLVMHQSCLALAPTASVGFGRPAPPTAPQPVSPWCTRPTPWVWLPFAPYGCERCTPGAAGRRGGRRTRPPEDASRWLAHSVGGRSRRGGRLHRAARAVTQKSARSSPGRPSAGGDVRTRRTHRFGRHHVPHRGRPPRRRVDPTCPERDRRHGGG